MRPLEYDKDWPPEIIKWKFEGSSNYSHDFSLYNLAGQPDEFGIFVFPKTMRAYVRGTKKASTVNYDNKAITWLGKAMAWRLNDSRDLVCKVVFRTKKPALKEDSGPAACVAVYSINEGNRLIASMSVPMLTEETQIRMAKHFSYNRMNIVWEGTKRKRGFTIRTTSPFASSPASRVSRLARRSTPPSKLFRAARWATCGNHSFFYTKITSTSLLRFSLYISVCF